MASTPGRMKQGSGPEAWVLWASGAFAIAILALNIPNLFVEERLGPDDLMRLQQVRDLLAGQDWFDVNQHRLLTPEQGDMHWSRLPDIFLSGFISLMTPIFGAHAAELLAVGIWPLVLFSAAIALMFVISERLGISRIGQICALAFFLGSAASTSYWPGRIDHHGLVVVLILGAFAALLARRNLARSGLALAAFTCAALSVAIEALPYVSSLLCLIGIHWVVRGSVEAKRMAALGMGLVFFSAMFYVLDAPGTASDRKVCDAYGISHFAAIAVSGGLFIVIGAFGHRAKTWRVRLWVGVTAVALTLIAFVWLNPNCFSDPYANLPEAVRQSWLQTVREAQSLPQLIQHDFARAVWIYGYVAAGVIAAIWRIRQSRPQWRLPWLSLLMMLMMSSLMTAWQVRGQLFSHVFAVVAASGAVGALHANWKRRGGDKSLFALIIGFVLLSPLTWRFAGDAAFRPGSGHQLSEQFAIRCLDRERYREIARLPAMRIHTPIDLGVPILAYTDHAVAGAPHQYFPLEPGSPARCPPRFYDKARRKQ
ncbi:MAG: hypothetical protein AAFV59_17985, partial [Pseudomonadota bacterium]